MCDDVPATIRLDRVHSLSHEFHMHQRERRHKNLHRVEASDKSTKKKSRLEFVKVVKSIIKSPAKRQMLNAMQCNNNNRLI